MQVGDDIKSETSKSFLNKNQKVALVIVVNDHHLIDHQVSPSIVKSTRRRKGPADMRKIIQNNFESEPAMVNKLLARSEL